MKRMIFVLASVVLVWGSGASKADPARHNCLGTTCRAYHHPRPRALKPLPCIPIRFLQWHPDTVVATITYADGHKSKSDSKNAGTTGQFCYGVFRFHEATQVELCNTDANAILTKEQIEMGLHRVHRDWRLCLKGSEWCGTHGAQTIREGAAP